MEEDSTGGQRDSEKREGNVWTDVPLLLVSCLGQEMKEKNMEERIEAAERERVMREKQMHQEEKLAKVYTLSSLDESLCAYCVLMLPAVHLLCSGDGAVEVGAAERRENEATDQGE